MSDLPIAAIDPDAYTDLDVAGTFRSLGPWWSLMVEGLDRAPLEDLLVEQAEVLAGAAGRSMPGVDPLAVTGVCGPALGAAPLDRAHLDPVLVRSLTLLRRAGRALATAGAFTAGAGAVHGLFRSSGGVPKLPQVEVAIGAGGIVGDRQHSRRHHGRPWQALCLWSKEKVDHLRAEGHPIGYGNAGENVSVNGVDWALVRPGTRLHLGADVLAEVSAPALPCVKNAQWFLDGNFSRMHHEREPGISRMYATVLRGGTLRTGDPVVLEP